MWPSWGHLAFLRLSEQVIECFCGLTLLTFEEVGVGVHRESSRCVSEATRDGEHLDAVPEPLARRRVA